MDGAGWSPGCALFLFGSYAQRPNMHPRTHLTRPRSKPPPAAEGCGGAVFWVIMHGGSAFMAPCFSVYFVVAVEAGVTSRVGTLPSPLPSRSHCPCLTSSSMPST